MTSSPSSLDLRSSVQPAPSLTQTLRRRSNSVNSIDLRPPRMPAALAERHLRQVSFPDSLRDSESPLDGGSPSTRGAKFDSKGTEFEITSFIGGQFPTVTRNYLINIPLGLTSGQDLQHRPSFSESSDNTGRSSLVLQYAERVSVTKPSMTSSSPLKQRSPPGGPPRKSSMRYIRPEELPLGPPTGRLGLGRGTETRSDTNANQESLKTSTGLPRGPRLLSSLGRATGSPVRKDMISSPRPLGAVASQSTRVFEQPRQAPAAPRPPS
jgi:hypothetical protein